MTAHRLRNALLIPLLLVSVAVGVSGAVAARIDDRGGSQVGRIDYAVDGDTLRVSMGAKLVYVRMVGIDTPEDVQPGTPEECGSTEAASSLKAVAPEGAQVRLVFDSVADHEDKYGRLLAHALVGGRQLEVVQLRRGWATVYRFDGQPFDGLPRFKRAESVARNRSRGVWGSCGGDFHSSS